MKRVSSIFFGLLLVVSSYAGYNIGDVCVDLEWTTEDGVTTSIYEQVDEGKAVVIFIGQLW